MNILLLTVISVSILYAEDPSWQITGEMKYPVSGAKAIVHDSLIYVIGGYSDSLQTNVKWIQRFDPATNSWTIVANMIEKRYGLFVGVHYDRLYIYGGINEVNENSFYLEEWDFVSPNTTIFSTNELFDRVFSTGIVKDDKFIMIGGYAASRGSSAELPYIANFDFQSLQIGAIDDTSYLSNELPIQQMSVLVNDKLYVLGGAFNGVLQSIDAINPVDFSSSPIGPRIISPRAAGVSVYSPYSEMLYLIGGYNETVPAISSTEMIADIESSPIVSETSSLNYARRNLSAVVYKEMIYVFGGENVGGKVVPFIEKLFAGPVSFREEDNIQNEFELYQNYPNPFNPETNINYTVEHAANIQLDVFNSIGEKVNTLYSGYSQPGLFTIRWDGKDENGIFLSTGIYFYRLSSERNFITKKMLLLK